MRGEVANANDGHGPPPHAAYGHRLAGERRQWCWPFYPIRGVPVMKTIISALLALSVLTGVAASANAFDAKSFYEELDRSRT
jgi:hypothetical protein